VSLRSSSEVGAGSGGDGASGSIPARMRGVKVDEVSWTISAVVLHWEGPSPAHVSGTGDLKCGLMEK